jgi:hypothetical protein
MSFITNHISLADSEEEAEFLQSAYDEGVISEEEIQNL